MKPRIDLHVNQVPGYYRIDLRIFLGNRLAEIEQGLHIADQASTRLADEIRENFAVTECRPGFQKDSVLIKCLRKELRKIETWLILQGYNVTPLKRWKNERL